MLDLPEGTPLEQPPPRTRAIARRAAGAGGDGITRSTSGRRAPFNFNGLVRHYFLRQGPNVADLQVNLLPKGERKAQSHEIAKRVRPALEAPRAPDGAD